MRDKTMHYMLYYDAGKFKMVTSLYMEWANKNLHLLKAKV